TVRGPVATSRETGKERPSKTNDGVYQSTKIVQHFRKHINDEARQKEEKENSAERFSKRYVFDEK
ncbi:162_t:CDS:2, partial [Racocetra persica]